MNIRRNFTALDGDGRAKLVSAFLKLKREGNPASGRNYDTYVGWHHHVMPFAHKGPAFLPWHRQYLLLIEKDLQDVSGDPTLTVPYWDWTGENGPASSLWDADFMGGDGTGPDGRVTSGPFSADSGSWRLAHSDSGLNYLTRSFRLDLTLPTAEDVARAMAVDTYDAAPWNAASNINESFRNAFEGNWPGGPHLHNQVHGWVGGEMASMTSPNDPVFWLHHSNCDRIWAEWQDAKLTHGYLPLEPLPGRPGHSLNERLAMMGDATIASVLNFRALGYRYDTTPEASPLAVPPPPPLIMSLGLDYATAAAFISLENDNLESALAGTYRKTGPYAGDDLDMRRPARY